MKGSRVRTPSGLPEKRRITSDVLLFFLSEARRNAPKPGTYSIPWPSGKVLGIFFLFHIILYLCIMNILEQLVRLVLPKEILDNFDIVKIETDESDIDSMSMTIHLLTLSLFFAIT